MLSRMARPAAGDTFFASQGVLELLGPASLTKVAKVLFFSCRVPAANAAGDRPGDRHRVCLLVEGTSRAVLFDRADFSLGNRSEEHTSELQSLMRISYAVFCLKKKKTAIHTTK